MHENWGEKPIICSDFQYVSNILTLPSIICANKRSGGCKISSRYFSKMLSTPRYRNYRPVLSFERRVQSPFQGKATSQPLSLDCEQICKSRQEQGPFRSSCLPHPKEGSGKSGCQVIPGLLQPSFSSSQAQQQMASRFGFKHSQSFPRDKNLQNGNSRDHTTVSTTRGMGHLAGKYQRFHLNKVNYQFKALPFGLAMAPLEFTKVVKEVKLMAQARGIRIHQYLDNWLLRARCLATCLQHTRTLLDLCQELGWVVNMKKSELTPQQVFNFVGYRFDLKTSRVLPTQDRWSALKVKLQFLKNWTSCSVR